MKNKKKSKYIFCRIPLRVSIFGGGSDLPSFLKIAKVGSVVNFTINKYVYIFAKIHSDIFDHKYRLNYFISENVNSINKIENKIIKSSLKFYNFKEPLYLSTISDVPSGTGLGSSGAFLSGVCYALNNLQEKYISKSQVAHDASIIDIKKNFSEGGYQDQYASSFGGFNKFIFFQNGKFKQNKISDMSFMRTLCNRSFLIYTGFKRDSNRILKAQNEKIISDKNFKMTKRLSEIAEEFYFNSLNVRNSYENYLELLKESWFLKKNLSTRISNSKINDIIVHLEKQKNVSFKLLGAGGGGFILCSFTSVGHMKTMQQKISKKYKIIFFKNETKGIFKIN